MVPGKTCVPSKGVRDLQQGQEDLLRDRGQGLQAVNPGPEEVFQCGQQK